MKVICVKKHLKDAVGLCEKITGKNLSLPVLSNVLFSAEKGKLKLTATNLEIGLEMEVPAKIVKEGTIAVPAGILNNFLSSFSDGENITLKEQNSNLLVLTPNTSTTIKGQPSDDFPALPSVKGGKEVEIPASGLVEGLKSVWYAASLLNIKPEISSVYVFSSDEGRLTFVATDSFRLAEKKIAAAPSGFESILVPLKSATEILRIFDGKEGAVKLVSDKNQVVLSLGGIKFVSRLTEGIFPDYGQIIPSKFSTDVVVDKELFTNTMRTAAIFSGKLNEVNISVGADDNLLAVSTSSSDAGEHAAAIKAETTGEELKMSFNHRYVFDCLQHIPSRRIVLRFSGEGKPLVMAGTDDNSFQYLVMPMNTL